MNWVFPALAFLQAALLLWGAVCLSNLALRPKKFLSVLGALVAVGGSLAIARYGVTGDTHRVLCSLTDCIMLSLSVAGLRVFFVNKEEDQIALEYAEARRRAAAAAALARETQKAEQLKAAAAVLEARAAEAMKRAVVDPTLPPRHLTPSLLRGGAPSPRLPTAPRK